MTNSLRQELIVLLEGVVTCIEQVLAIQLHKRERLSVKAAKGETTDDKGKKETH
jgi:uncharacterized protein YbcI